MAANDEEVGRSLKTFHVLLGVTGSVAAIKVPLLVEKLLQLPGVQVRVVATQNSLHFFDQNLIPVQIYEDKDEWQIWTKIGDPVLHIELRRWADLFLIAPLDANTLAKLSHGICDNLFTNIARAWDLSKPFIYCPAMNTLMWEHPVTNEHLAKLDAFKYIQVPPISKTLACGDCEEGFRQSEVIVRKLFHNTSQKIRIGGMAEVSTIVEVVHKHLIQN